MKKAIQILTSTHEFLKKVSHNGFDIKYEYDAWGNHKVYAIINGNIVDITNDNNYNNHISKINPFRYRSYYFDTETGLYYLNSRYYDPEVGRFINADDISILLEGKDIINGLNLYAYCGNNPIMNTDKNGTSWWDDFWRDVGNFFKNTWDVFVGTIASIGLIAGGIALTIFSGGTLLIVGGALIAAGIGGFIGGLQSKLNGGSYWGGYLGGFISGALTGLGALFGPIGVFFGGFLGHLAGTVVIDSINGVGLNNRDYWFNLVSDSLLSGIIAIGAYGFGNTVSSLNIPGFRDIFASIKVSVEFIFSHLFEETKRLIHALIESISGKTLIPY